jgi:hypothetical protein
VSNALIDRDLRSFSVTLFDNDGVFDSDPAIGTIADPVGIAVLTPATPTTSEGGGGGGCVLYATRAASSDPVFPLSILVAAGAVYRRRRPGNNCDEYKKDGS